MAHEVSGFRGKPAKLILLKVWGQFKPFGKCQLLPFHKELREIPKIGTGFET
jgi:hypothetical protein